MDPRDKHSRPRQIVADAAPALFRRLPAYVYLSDLWQGRRVIEIGCGDGAAAAYLARSGAAQVLGLDRSPAHIDLARARQRAANLAFGVADFAALDLEDGIADVICVPAGAELARWGAFLDEVRRVLHPDGILALSVTSSDRPGGAGGMSYHDLRSRLQPDFNDVRMIGITPFVGFALVEYAEADVVEVELDSSLADQAPREQPTDYLALASADLGDPRGFMVVEVPQADGLSAVAQARGTALADRALVERLADAEAAAQHALARLAEVEAAGRNRGDDELKRRLARTVDERNAAEADLHAVRQRLNQADEEVGRVAAQAAREVNEARRQVQLAASHSEAVEAQILEHRRELEARTQALATLIRRNEELEAAAAQAKPDDDRLETMARAAAQHEAAMRSRVLELAERDAYVDELKQELEEVALAERAAADAAREASVRSDELEDDLRELRQRLSSAEGELLRQKRQPPAGPDPRIVELEQTLAEKSGAVDKATARWKEAEGKSDELWRKIGELQKELGTMREQSVETARQQRQAAQIALTRAVDEASKKLVSAQDACSRAEKETQALRVRFESEAAAASERITKAEGEVEQGRQRLASLEVELARPRTDPSVIALREELDRERGERASAEEEIRRLQKSLGTVHAQLAAQAETTSPTPGDAVEATPPPRDEPVETPPPPPAEPAPAPSDPALAPAPGEPIEASPPHEPEAHASPPMAPDLPPEGASRSSEEQ